MTLCDNKNASLSCACDAEAETALLTINLSALKANWRKLKSIGANAECGAVIKANAYGLGYAPVMRALHEAGCRTFFVATIAEGEAARQLFSDATIFVLDGIVIGGANRLVAAQLTPIIGSYEELEDWSKLSNQLGRKLQAGIHFDTGMRRLGFGASEAAHVAQLCRQIEPILILSHFVSAQIEDSDLNIKQLSQFDVIRRHFPNIAASMANSSAVFLSQRPHFDLLRPGYALYGGNPTPAVKNPMQSVIKLHARILVVRDIEAGDCVGYDATWIASRPSKIATLAIGYADGLHLSASGHNNKPAAKAFMNGHYYPYIGRVSMDYIVIDVTDAPDGSVKRGDFVELLGPHISIEDFAAAANVIGYEVLTRLGARYTRQYIEEDLGALAP